MFGLGFQEILFLLLIALLLFGATKLPEVGRALGKAIREFKKASKSDKNDDEPGDEQNKGKS